MPTFTINGISVDVPEGTTVLQAAETVGIEIPHYCYHPKLSIAGNCRMCLVEVEKFPKLQIACNTFVTDGMVVKSNTEKVRQAVTGVLEFLLIHHPVDCPICDQAGECGLQIYYMKYGLHKSRYALQDKVHKKKVQDIGGQIILDAERCILCYRCIRFLQEVTGTSELEFFQRGDHSEISLFPGRPLDNQYTGNLAD
ncbi:MAG: 2Fe-2S iron-sulfur cluster binding domain-containing protein, partial [Deltaproteobacteria bacterium]|nr:2Fe-2S iron-sulfur cluster binding domain-containing protein [Deltaproteobacteria bacterium]